MAEAIARPLRNAARQFGKFASSTAQNDAYTRFVLLNQVPRSVTASDVLRALKQSKLVGDDFPLNAITPPPPTALRRPTITKSFHITLADPTTATQLVKRLRVYPLFPSLAIKPATASPSASLPRDRPDNRDSGDSGDSNSNSSSRTRNSGSGSSPVHRDAAWQVKPNAANWLDQAIASASILPSSSSVSAPSRASRERREREYGNGNGNGNGSDASEGARNRMLAKEDQGDEQSFRSREKLKLTADWLLDESKRGKMVLVRGLPFGLPMRTALELATKSGLDTDCPTIRLEPSYESQRSSWVMTADSVTNAHRLASRLNMNYYRVDLHGEKYLMRAEVVS